VLSDSIQQLLLVITNGQKEMHARTLTSAWNGLFMYWIRRSTRRAFIVGTYCITVRSQYSTQLESA